MLTGAKVLKTFPMDYDMQLGGRNPSIVVPELSMEEVQVKDCPPGHMPYIMQPLNPAQAVVFLWTQWNVFLPRSKNNPTVPALFDKCLGKSKATVRTRLYCWAERLSGCQFPQFNPNVHILTPDRLPREGTDITRPTRRWRAVISCFGRGWTRWAASSCSTSFRAMKRKGPG